jgi:hypothetical protein
MFKIHIVFTKILGDITMSAKLSKEFWFALMNYFPLFGILSHNIVSSWIEDLSSSIRQKSQQLGIIISEMVNW